jgi:hypothetical protein
MKKLGLLLTSSLFIGQIYTSDSKFKLSLNNSLKGEDILKKLSERRLELNVLNSYYKCLTEITAQNINVSLEKRKFLEIIKHKFEISFCNCSAAITGLNLELMPETQREAARKIKGLKRDILKTTDYLSRLTEIHHYTPREGLSDWIYLYLTEKLLDIIGKNIQGIKNIQQNMPKFQK